MSSLLEAILLLVWSSLHVNSPQLRVPAPIAASSHPQDLTDTRAAPSRWNPELSGSVLSPSLRSCTAVASWAGLCLEKGFQSSCCLSAASQPVHVHHFLATQHSQRHGPSAEILLFRKHTGV